MSDKRILHIMPDKINFTFENLSRRHVHIPDRWLLTRGTVREIWENFLESVGPEHAEKFRAGEDRIQFSTKRINFLNRHVLMWHETPAETDDFLYAYYPMSLLVTTSYLTNEALAAAATLAGMAQQEKMKKEQCCHLERGLAGVKVLWVG